MLAFLLAVLFWSSSCDAWHLVPDPPFRHHLGQWHYRPATANQRYGHFLYTSPMGKVCQRNLTIVVQTWQCLADGISQDRSVPQEFSDSEDCVPQALEVVAMLIDKANGVRDMLVDTCLQASSLHLRNNSQMIQAAPSVFHDAVSTSPTKHGFITTFSRGWADSAAGVGLQVLEVDKVDRIRSNETSSVFMVRSDMSWVLPHIFAELLPPSIALLLDDSTARDALPAIKQTAKALSKTIALVEVLPSTDDEVARSGVLSMLDAMVRLELRYLLMIITSVTAPSIVSCALYEKGLHTHIQVLLVGAAHDIYAELNATPCDAHPGLLRTLSYQSGWLAVSSANHLISGAALDHLFTLPATGGVFSSNDSTALDLNGAPFALGPPLPAPAVSGCADDETGINGSRLLRQLLRKADGMTLTCREVAPLGHQPLHMPWLTNLAEHCPVTVCGYNPRSHACRMSCACDPQSGRCATPATLPMLELNMASAARCDGAACRRLPFAASATSLLDKLFGYALLGSGFCAGRTCSLWNKLSVSAYLAPQMADGLWNKLSVSAYLAPQMADGLWAFVEAFRCVERRWGTHGLQRVADHGYGDAWVAEVLHSCLVQEVRFSGMGGTISFGYRQSPEPGDTVPIIHSPHPFSDSYTVNGLILRDGVLLASRTFQRRNVSSCQVMYNALSPGLLCKREDVDDYLLDRDGPPSEALPPGSPQTCDPGSYPLALGEDAGFGRGGQGAGVFQCVPCPPGTWKGETSDRRCLPCPPGFYSEVLGQSECTPCGRNWRGSDPPPPLQLRDGREHVVGSAACERCPPGYVSDVGSRECSPCQPGTARSSADDDCKLCPSGTFQDESGASACRPCDSVLSGSTSLRGSQTASECLCPPGTVAMPDTGCVLCGEGLQCPGGTAHPLQLPGFWGTAKDQAGLVFSMLTCRNELECPSGPVGTCAMGRYGVACSQCQPVHYRVSSGACLPCEGRNFLAPMAAALAVAGALGGVSYFSSLDSSKQHLSTVTVAATLGQATSALQVLGAFNRLQVKWMDPFAAVLDTVSLLTLDLDVVRVTCVMPKDDPVMRFVAQLLALPCCIVTLAVIRFLAKSCRRCGGQNHGDFVFSNSTGFVTLTFYISLTLTVLAPLQCRANPNGTQSMALDRGVICWTSSVHRWLVGLACVGMLAYPVVILAAVLTATLLHPSWVVSGRGQRSLRHWRFLFKRFIPSRYYYGAWYLVRNTLVAVIPVALANLQSLQLLGMSILLQCSALLQVYLWPWRTPTANAWDCLSCLALSFFLSAGIMLVTLDQDEAQNVVQWLLMVALVIAFASLPASLALAIRRRILAGKRYGAFLCHHKEGAGSLSRLLKISVGSMSTSNVFLDSDELENLDLIFDVVRSDAQNLVVVQSSEVLKRMWCAGEIATAYRNKVPMVPLLCDGCRPVTDEELSQIEQWWSPEQQNTLLSFDIDINLIREAYRHLASLPALTLPRFGSLSEKSEVVEEMLTRCCLPRRPFARRLEEGLRPRVLVAGATSDPEAFSACEIVAVTFQAELEMETLVVRTAEQVEASSATAHFLVILLTKGVLEDLGFASVLAAALLSDHEGGARPPLQVVTVLADQGFAFPTAEFYQQLADQGLGGLDGAALGQVYRSVLSILALPFTPRGSSGLIQLQLSEVARRLQSLTAKEHRADTSATKGKQSGHQGDEEEEHGADELHRELHQQLHQELHWEEKQEVEEPHWECNEAAAVLGPGTDQTEADLLEGHEFAVDDDAAEDLYIGPTLIAMRPANQFGSAEQGSRSA